MGEPNILLDALIDQAGISHAGLASRINAALGTRYDHTAVARWIRDGAIPRGRAPEVLCEILSARLGRTLTLADIGMCVRAGDHEASDLPAVIDQATALWRKDARHPGFLAGVAPVAGPAAVVPVFEWEHPPDDMDVSRTGGRVIGHGEIQRLRYARHRYEQMYRRVGGIPVHPRLVGFLTGHVTPMLHGSYSDQRGRELFRAVGSLTALAGICAYDADRQALAQRYFLHALRMAKASGDRAFGGYVVALLANQAMHQANYRLVVQYAETALRAAGRHLTPALISDLCTLQAKAYARMGDKASCHLQMRRSEAMAARIRPDDELSEAGYVQPGLVEIQHAEALRQLGDLRMAEEYALEGVRTAGDAHIRGQAHRYAGLAIIRAEQGRVDEALEPAHEMLSRVAGMESGRILDRLRAVRDALTSRSSGPEVREFSERVESEINVPL